MPDMNHQCIFISIIAILPYRHTQCIKGHNISPVLIQFFQNLQFLGCQRERRSSKGNCRVGKRNRENLQIICILKNVPECAIDNVLKIVRLEKQQDKKVKNYSLGMKQRLGLAAALLGRPKLLLLDKPTNGLDPAGIQEMRELICSLPGKYGITILVSSHLLSEIDQMATHVGIIDKGKMIFQDDLANLHHHSRSRIQIRTTDDGRAFRLLKQARIPVSTDERTSGFCLNTTEDSCVLRCGRLLNEQDIGILRLEEMQMSLEEIFLNLTGKQDRYIIERRNL